MAHTPEPRGAPADPAAAPRGSARSQETGRLLGGQVVDHAPQDFGGAVRLLGDDAQPLHRHGVLVDLPPAVQAHRPGELFQVDDVGQAEVRVAQNGERPRLGGVRARAEGDDLERDVGALAELLQPLELPAHDVGPADRATHSGLVDDRPQLAAAIALDVALAPHAHRDPVLGHGIGNRPRGGDDRAGVLLGLKHAGHELRLVDADAGGGLLKADIDLEPVGQRIAVVLPPAGLLGFARQLDHGLDLDLVGDAVQLQQVLDIADLEADPSQFHPADLRFRTPDVVARLAAGHPARLTRLAEFGSEQHTPDCGTAPPLQTSYVHSRSLPTDRFPRPDRCSGAAAPRGNSTASHDIVDLADNSMGGAGKPPRLRANPHGRRLSAAARDMAKATGYPKRAQTCFPEGRTGNTPHPSQKHPTRCRPRPLSNWKSGSRRWGMRSLRSRTAQTSSPPRRSMLNRMGSRSAAVRRPCRKALVTSSETISSTSGARIAISQRASTPVQRSRATAAAPGSGVRLHDSASR